MGSLVQAQQGEPEKSTCESKCFFQRCVPQAERDAHFVRDVSFGREVCLRHVIRNTSHHCDRREQHHYAKHNITWRSQTSLNIFATILHPNTKVLVFQGLFVFLGVKNASSFHYFCLITTLIYVGLCLFLMIDIALTPIIRTIMNGRPI